MTEERIYSIPLRKEVSKVPRYKRANKAAIAVREFLQKHMKCKNVKLGRYLNMKILENGRKNVPHHVEVKVVKENIKIKDKEVEIVRAELVGAPTEEIKKDDVIKEKKKSEEKEISKVIKEKEKEKEKEEKTPKPKRGELADKASKDVASGVMEHVVHKQKPKHMKPKE